MRILILGGDGYLGWPTAMALATKGYEVTVADNYLRRRLALETDSQPLFDTPLLPERVAVFNAVYGRNINVRIMDLTNSHNVENLFSVGGYDVVIHYAEQPSAPYSMTGEHEARLTLQNNLNVTFNIIWAVIKYCPDCHIIKLGTMGEYGTPSIDIEEGYINIAHKGRTDRFLFPRQAGTLYHTTKVLDTDLLWFYVRLYGIRVTDLMQGPVYGLHTSESRVDTRLLPHFFYDDIFGTVLNRFLVQAIAGVPLTVYGAGGQTRGYLNIKDTLACVALAMLNPPEKGELRIFNQFTETFSVLDLAHKVQEAGKAFGIDVAIKPVPNPRKELEAHYYNPAHSKLLDIGLESHLLTTDVLVPMLASIVQYRDRINQRNIFPRIAWHK